MGKKINLIFVFNIECKDSMFVKKISFPLLAVNILVLLYSFQAVLLHIIESELHSNPVKLIGTFIIPNKESFLKKPGLRVGICYSGLSYCLRCPQPNWIVWFKCQLSLLLFQLPADACAER